MVNKMVKVHTLILVDLSMLGNTRMGTRMVKELTLGLVDLSMLGNTRMVKKMVKEHGLSQLVDTGLKGNGSGENTGTMAWSGTEQDITKMGKSL